jgi:hypothetical protein
MDEMNDEDLAQLVSLGGWLRGTDALTSIVNDHYTAEGAELLHQPELVHYFERCINTMQSRLKNNPTVLRVRDALRQIAPIIEEKSKNINQTKVQKIQSITDDVILKINATF